MAQATPMGNRSDVSVQDSSALELLNKVEAAVDWMGNKQFFERQWAINQAFLLGHQDISWDRYGQQPYDRRFAKHRTTYTANKVIDAYEKAVTLLTQTAPRWASAPGTSSLEDTFASRVANKLLEHYEHELEMNEKDVELVQWAALTGTAFYYNTAQRNARTKQRIYFDPFSRQPMPAGALSDTLRRTLEQTGAYRDYYATEPDVAVLSPYRVIFEPAASSVDQARYMLHITPMSIDEIYERWDVIADQEDPPVGMTNWESRLRSFWGPMRGSGARGDHENDDKQTIVKEVVVKPHVEFNPRTGKYDEYPDGRHVVIAGGKIVVNDVNHYHVAGFRNGFPVTETVWHKVPGRIWGMGLVEIMIDPQKAYNDIRRRTLDMFRLMGQPKWISPYGAGLKRDAINDRPGEIIEFNASAGPAPQSVTPTPFPPHAVEHLAANASRDLQDSAAQHDLMQSRIPSEMRSGPAMQMAMEGDMMSLGPKNRSLERCRSRVGENLMRTAAEVLDDASLHEILGPQHGMDVTHFRAASLKGVKSIRVIRGSMMPESQGLIFQRALDMVATGGLNPQGSDADREVLIRASQFHEFDPEIQDATQERRKHERQVEMLFLPLEHPGFAVPLVNAWDNDQIAIKVLLERMRSPEFDRLPEVQQKLIEGKFELHAKRLRKAEESRMMMLMAAKGAPGQKGTPSPPKQQRK